MASILNKSTALLSRFAKVGAAVGREVYKREQLSPPDLSKFGQASNELGSALIKLFSTSPANYTVLQVARAGLLGVEVFGFYYLGEVIGKRRLVGYAH